MTYGIILGGFSSFEIQVIKELQIMKGLLKIENSIINQVDRYKMWPITF